MSFFRSAALAILLLTSPCMAQPRTGKVQPDQIDFGTVYTGAIVEGSVLVYEAGQDANIELAVTAPKFVKILGKSIEARQFGPRNEYVCGSVEIAIDTSATGKLNGEVSLTLGRTKVRIPVKATVEQLQPGRPRILAVATPFSCYSTDDGKMFTAWTNLAKEAKADVSYLLVRKQKTALRDIDLTPFTCVLLADSGLISLTPEEIEKVRKYAQGGGRVVVAANGFMMGSIKKANEVLDGSGLVMREREARQVTVRKEGLDELVLDAGINSVQFFRPSPIGVEDGVRGQVLVKASGVGEPGDGFVARARIRRGEVIAIGQSMWWHWITEEQAAGADNGKLLIWLLMPPQRK